MIESWFLIVSFDYLINYIAGIHCIYDSVSIYACQKVFSTVFFSSVLNNQLNRQKYIFRLYLFQRFQQLKIAKFPVVKFLQQCYNTKKKFTTTKMTDCD